MNRQERLAMHGRILAMASAGLESRGLDVLHTYDREIAAVGYDSNGLEIKCSFVVYDGLEKLEAVEQRMIGLNKELYLPAGLILVWDGQEIGGIPVTASRRDAKSRVKSGTQEYAQMGSLIRSDYFNQLSSEEKRNHIRLRESEKFAMSLHPTPGNAQGTITYVDPDKGKLTTYEAFRVKKQIDTTSKRSEFVKPGNYSDVSKLVAIPEDELIFKINHRAQNPKDIAYFRREFVEDILLV